MRVFLCKNAPLVGGTSIEPGPLVPRSELDFGEEADSIKQHSWVECAARVADTFPGGKTYLPVSNITCNISGKMRLDITISITESRQKSKRLIVYDRDNLVGRVTENLRLRPSSTRIWLNAYLQFETRIIHFSGCQIKRDQLMDEVRDFLFPFETNDSNSLSWTEVWKILVVRPCAINITVFLTIDDWPKRCVDMDLMPTSLILEGRGCNSLTSCHLSAIAGLSTVLEEDLKLLEKCSNYKMDYSVLVIAELCSFAHGWDIVGKLGQNRLSSISVDLLKLACQYQIATLWEVIVDFLVKMDLQWFELDSALELFQFLTRKDLPVDFKNEFELLSSKVLRIVAMKKHELKDSKFHEINATDSRFREEWLKFTILEVQNSDFLQKNLATK